MSEQRLESRLFGFQFQIALFIPQFRYAFAELNIFCEALIPQSSPVSSLITDVILPAGAGSASRCCLHDGLSHKAKSHHREVLDCSNDG